MTAFAMILKKMWGMAYMTRSPAATTPHSNIVRQSSPACACSCSASVQEVQASYTS